MIENIGIFLTKYWKKLMLAITLFIVFFPALILSLNYFVINNNFILEVNNFSSRPCRIVVRSESGIVAEKEIAPFEKHHIIKRFSRWNKLYFRAFIGEKQQIYLNKYESIVYDFLPGNPEGMGKIYEINIPEDKYIDLIEAGKKTLFKQVVETSEK
ncbi:MAG: hypothetical protein LWY06_05640 [Firmicutes bacterium]|nr:hypothetical protein [Bacillota bacterium]